MSPSSSQIFSRKMILNILLIMFAGGAEKKLKLDMHCLFAKMHADLSGVTLLSHIRIVNKETYTKKVMVC